MGHFMQLGGVLESEQNVQRAVEGLKASHEIFNSVGYYSEKDDRVLLFFDDYDSGAEEALEELSRKLETAAFYFHIHDGDLWMYHFYVKGVELDKFNTQPDYWEELTDEQKKAWAGKPAVIEAHWSDVRKEDIERYFLHHNDNSISEKAYPEDEFEPWDIWQLTDFTAKLGIPYPDEEEE